MDDLKPYFEYKDSEPWLGAVPAHWRLLRAKYVLREIDNRWTEKSGRLLSVSQYTGVTKRRLREGSDEPATRSETLEGYKVVATNDLAVNIMLAWNGSMGVSPFDGVVSPAYCVYRFREGDPWFFHALLRSPLYRAEIKRRSRGVVESRLRLYTDDLFRMPLLVPPPDEQSAIVRFLVALDRRVNRFVLAKRRLIELLTEQKQAIITHAVTRGPKPNAKLKPSGIDWLGNVPEHWQIGSMKRLLARVDYGTSEQARPEGAVKVLTMGNIQAGEVSTDRCGRLDLDSVPTDLLLDEHDLLFTRTNGNPDLVGKVGLFRGTRDDNVSFASYLVRLRVKSPHNPIWLHFLLNSNAFWPYARSFALVNLQTNLNASRYIAFAIPVPPQREQTEIVNGVAVALQPIESTIQTATREIALIREYRTRLVSDVVTGKLDVRDAARNLSDDGGEAAEPLDVIEDETTDTDALAEDPREEAALAEE